MRMYEHKRPVILAISDICFHTNHRMSAQETPTPDKHPHGVEGFVRDVMHREIKDLLALMDDVQDRECFRRNIKKARIYEELDRWVLKAQSPPADDGDIPGRDTTNDSRPAQPSHGRGRRRRRKRANKTRSHTPAEPNVSPCIKQSVE